MPSKRAKKATKATATPIFLGTKTGAQAKAKGWSSASQRLEARMERHGIDPLPKDTPNDTGRTNRKAKG